jgi:GDSL-like Lipase/Acylhydrolase family
MTHIALLGDSVIDNKAYVGDGPDVAAQVRKLVPKEWRVTRLAIDGAYAWSVLGQLEDLPTDTTHIVISAGGNDALGESGVLDTPARSVAEVLQLFAGIQDRFREDYASMLDATAQRKLPTAVCTVYDPRFPDPLRRRMSSLALSVINDVVTREAFSRDLSLIDLRVIFNADEDFANPIEPSVQGGMKLAQAILRFASMPLGETRVIR